MILLFCFSLWQIFSLVLVVLFSFYLFFQFLLCYHSLCENLFFGIGGSFFLLPLFSIPSVISFSLRKSVIPESPLSPIISLRGYPFFCISMSDSLVPLSS